MTLLSISAKAVWICGKARPAGVVVSMGELRVRNATPRWVEFVDDGDEFAGASAEAIEIEDDEDLAPAQGIEAGGEVRALRRDAGGVIFEDALAADAFNASSWRSRTWRPSAMETRA